MKKQHSEGRTADSRRFTQIQKQGKRGKYKRKRLLRHGLPQIYTAWNRRLTQMDADSELRKKAETTNEH